MHASNHSPPRTVLRRVRTPPTSGCQNSVSDRACDQDVRRTAGDGHARQPCPPATQKNPGPTVRDSCVLPGDALDRGFLTFREVIPRFRRSRRAGFLGIGGFLGGIVPCRTAVNVACIRFPVGDGSGDSTSVVVHLAAVGDGFRLGSAATGTGGLRRGDWLSRQRRRCGLRRRRQRWRVRVRSLRRRCLGIRRVV